MRVNGVHGVQKDGSPAPTSGKHPALYRPRRGEEHRGARVHGVVREGAAGDFHAGVVPEGICEAESHGEARGVTSVRLRFDDGGGPVVLERAVGDCWIAAVEDVHSSFSEVADVGKITNKQLNQNK